LRCLRSTHVNARPAAVPIVQVTVRDPLLFSLTIGASPRTDGARSPDSTLARRNDGRPSAPIRCAGLGFIASMAFRPNPLLPAQDPPSTRIAGESSGGRNHPEVDT